ncbi:hypothetical protein [Planctomonas psychrotolerans]|uniref:hypothetical protein n=1 Tax=Planctomonas psychrotolerans TaxID=2528712 RepID=UPI001D0D1953|nr:hypothetical protein [Planctomonas psychrotolerans]
MLTDADDVIDDVVEDAGLEHDGVLRHVRTGEERRPGRLAVLGRPKGQNLPAEHAGVDHLRP